MNVQQAIDKITEMDERLKKIEDIIENEQPPSSYADLQKKVEGEAKKPTLVKEELKDVQ